METAVHDSGRGGLEFMRGPRPKESLQPTAEALQVCFCVGSIFILLSSSALAAGTQDANNPKEPLKLSNDRLSGLVRAEDAVPTRGGWGEWHRYFRGDTHGTKDMVVLAVTLKPGQAPHPPHHHAEEEFMILADGNGTWTLNSKEIA